MIKCIFFSNKIPFRRNILKNLVRLWGYNTAQGHQLGCFQTQLFSPHYCDLAISIQHTWWNLSQNVQIQGVTDEVGEGGEGVEQDLMSK